MELTLTTFDEASCASARIVLEAPAGSPGELIDDALGEHLGRTDASWFLGDRPLSELRFGEPPLVDGAVLTRAETAGGARSQMHLLVLEGPACGQHRLLRRGHVSIGKDGAEFCLPDDSLHPVHAVLRVEAERLMVEEVSGTTRRIEAGRGFALAGSRLMVGTGTETGEDPRAVPATEGPLPPRAVELAAPGTGWKTLLLTLALPLVLGGVLAWAFSLWMLLVFSMMSSLMGLVHWLSRGSATARNRERVRQACALDLALSEATAPALGVRLMRAGCIWPLRAQPSSTPSARSDQSPWLRWGRGERPAHLRFSGHREHPVPTMRGAPILSRLDVDHVLIGGPDLLDPTIAQILLAGWDVAVLAPETLPPGHPVRPWLAHPRVHDAEPTSERVPACTVLLCCGPTARVRGLPEGPRVWYLDAARSPREHSLPPGPAVIVRAEQRGLVLTAAGSRLPVDSLPGIGPAVRLRCLHPDGLARQARTAMLRQARVSEHGSGGASHRLSRRHDLALERLDLRWARVHGPELWADLGHDDEGHLLSLDLNADGPHCVIAGTTGSGKSEFFRAFLASLALRYSPARLGFVLIDFKGGASFGPVGGFPHVHALLTDLDEATVHRDLSFLQAELARREKLFRELGVSSWQECMRRQRPLAEPLPELMICVDEFRMLVDSMPDAMGKLLKIATVGRSLGIHLVMSTQRPQGAISADIRANVSINVCLRVATEADSVNVLGSPEASRIPMARAGYGYLQAGGRLRSFTGQFYDGLPHEEKPGEVRVRWDSAPGLGARPKSIAAAPCHDVSAEPATRGTAPGDDSTDAGLPPDGPGNHTPTIPSTDETVLLKAWHDLTVHAVPTSMPRRVVPIVPSLPQEQWAASPAPATTSGVVLGCAETPRLGWQEEAVWSPPTHGPLEGRGPVPEQTRLVDRLVAEAARLGLPCYAVVTDPSVVAVLRRREKEGLDLRGVAILERPEFCREMLATLLDRARRAAPVRAAEPTAKGDREGGVLIVQGADVLVEQLSRRDPAAESRVQELTARLGRNWHVCLLGTKPLPRGLRALCPSQLHLGAAARQEFLLSRPREGRDLVEGLCILEGSLAPSSDPAGLWIPEAGPLRTTPTRRRGTPAWPRLHDLPDALEWVGAEATQNGSPRVHRRTHRALDLPDRWFLTLGVDAPEGREAGLPLKAGSVTGVVGRNAADTRNVVAAALAFNPHLSFRVFDPPRLSPSPPHAASPSPTARRVSAAREGAPVIAVVEEAHRWSASGLETLAAAVARCDAAMVVFDPGRFMPSRSPWAEALREAPAALVMGQRTGLEAEFRPEPCPATHGPVPSGTGLLLIGETSRRIRVAVPRVAPTPEVMEGSRGVLGPAGGTP